MANNTVFVTGGAGFIGSALIRNLIHTHPELTVVNIDKLTYAGDLSKLVDVSANKRYEFIQEDICNQNSMQQLFQKYRPKGIYHLAAESHVDRSIHNAYPFIQSNIIGTYALLEGARLYWNTLSDQEKNNFRFLHVSTDEVFGSLGDTGEFSETTAYAPNSPYSASKAASDHLVRAWHHTYGIPTLMSNCSNNYGPWQYPEKLIPVVITKALSGEKIPVYGAGANIRDWLYVEDHALALEAIFERGRPGETYNIGTRNEKRNLDLVRDICSILNKISPKNNGTNYQDQISFVTDRAGHDFRYAINPDKIFTELGWKPQFSYQQALMLTVKWYVENTAWCEKMKEKLK